MRKEESFSRFWNISKRKAGRTRSQQANFATTQKNAKAIWARELPSRISNISLRPLHAAVLWSPAGHEVYRHLEDVFISVCMATNHTERILNTSRSSTVVIWKVFTFYAAGNIPTVSKKQLQWFKHVSFINAPVSFRDVPYSMCMFSEIVTLITYFSDASHKW